jgi:hypothetical protein
MKSPSLKFGFRAILNTPLISNDFYSYHNETWLAAATHRLQSSAADGRAVMKEMCLTDWSIAGLREGHPNMRPVATDFPLREATIHDYAEQA